MRSRYQTRLSTSRLFLYCFLVLLASLVAANTEIRNFRVASAGLPLSASASAAAVLTDGRTWVRAQGGGGGGGGFGELNAGRNERSFRVRGAPVGTPLEAVCEGDVWPEGRRPCPHELWLLLDLGGVDDDEEDGWLGWKRFEMFTIRLSWPASYPADFDVTLYSPDELDAYIHTVTRHPRIAESYTLNSSDGSEGESERDPEGPLSSPPLHSRVRYARIRLVDTGVRPNLPLPNPSAAANPSSSNKLDAEEDKAQEVPFTIILEPLLLGVLPASLTPTILRLVPLLVGVAFAFPYVMRYLEDVAAEARKELYGRKTKAD